MYRIVRQGDKEREVSVIKRIPVVDDTGEERLMRINPPITRVLLRNVKYPAHFNDWRITRTGRAVRKFVPDEKSTNVNPSGTYVYEMNWSICVTCPDRFIDVSEVRTRRDIQRRPGVAFGGRQKHSFQSNNAFISWAADKFGAELASRVFSYLLEGEFSA